MTDTVSRPFVLCAPICPCHPPKYEASPASCSSCRRPIWLAATSADMLQRIGALSTAYFACVPCGGRQFQAAIANGATLLTSQRQNDESRRIHVEGGGDPNTDPVALYLGSQQHVVNIDGES
jgi:hypothetical protein